MYALYEVWTFLLNSLGLWSNQSFCIRWVQFISEYGTRAIVFVKANIVTGQKRGKSVNNPDHVTEIKPTSDISILIQLWTTYLYINDFIY